MNRAGVIRRRWHSPWRLNRAAAPFPRWERVYWSEGLNEPCVVLIDAKRAHRDASFGVTTQAMLADLDPWCGIHGYAAREGCPGCG